MASMQLQLEQQRIQTELEKDKSDSLQVLLHTIQQQKMMEDHHSHIFQDEQQARHLLAEAAILEERAKTTALQADNSRMNQQLVELNSRSQPFMVPSASRSAQRSDQGQASSRHPLSLSSVPHSATRFTQQLAQSMRGLPTHLSSSTRPLPSLSEAQHQSLQTYTARHPEPLETIRQNSVYRAQLTATDTGIRSLLSRKDSTACERCGGIHEYVDDLCTAIISTNGRKCMPLSQEEEDHRITIKITHHFDPTPLHSPREIEPRSSHSSPTSIERDFQDATRNFHEEQEESVYNALLKEHIRNLLEQQPFSAPAQAPAHAPAPAQTAPPHNSVPAPNLALAQGDVHQSKTRSASASVPAQSLPPLASASVPAQRLPSVAPASQVLHSTSAAPQHLSAKAKLEYQKQQIIFTQAQQRLTSLSQPGAAKVKQTARQKEKDLAIVTNDKELLNGSVKLKEEAYSDDDADEIAAEQGDAIHCHNLMHPRSQVPVRNSIGFVNSAFIKADDESDSEDDDDDSEEEDDDTSSNYADDSVERDAERLELKTLRATKSAQAAELTLLRKQAIDRMNSEQQELLMYRTAALAQTIPVQAATGGRLQVALNPPAHGAWDDVAHLMKTYLPAYEKYKASCGASAETIFSAYSNTEKKRLSKLENERKSQK